jgi:hypothetical protein
MDASQVGLIGGLLGGALGVLGGAAGTFFSIKNTSGPDERAFMVRVAIAAWLIISAFIAGQLLLPRPYNWLLWIPYGIGLPFSIIWLNRRQAQIRSDEQASLARAAHRDQR